MMMKSNNITYSKISANPLPNASAENITFTDGHIKLDFTNEVSNTKIASFCCVVKDMEANIFNKMFNDNLEQDLEIIDFKIGKTLDDVKVKLSSTGQLLKNLQNIFKNLNIEYLIKFDIKLNREKSNIDDSETNEALKKDLLKQAMLLMLNLPCQFQKQLLVKIKNQVIFQ